ncbi:ABC transporter substrate-binding protein [uncultured Brevibacillus sp.]|uniref:ABC transporter substrate-binding protein n=1 Tax=uncultured Brevibacillus sp. TaxID=169970 RepID=UPI002592A5F3|nr:ABC transporter substrate-binding protein [uncultured Brevibacillus sp.]
MLRFYRFKQWFLLLLVSVVFLAGCTSATPSQTNGENDQSSGKGNGGEGGTVVIAAPIEPDTMDMHLTAWYDDANTRIYDFLLARNETGKIIPGLAESYSVSDDGKAWTFKLRKDVKFHSGAPLTAESVKLSVDRCLKICPDKSMLGPIEKVEVPEPSTVKITLTEKYAPFLTIAADFLAVLDPARVDELGDKFGNNPSATGPLVFREKMRGASLTYKLNKAYRWSPENAENKDAPYLDEVVFRFIKDDDTKMLEFKKGTIQIFQQVPTNYVKELESIPGVEISKTLEAGMNYLGFNNQHPFFQDVRVRQAIAMTVDRTPIVQYAMSGLAEPIHGPLPTTIPGYSQKVEEMAKEMYKRDITKSKQLLADAGWMDTNGDGILEKNGEPFSTELMIEGGTEKQKIAVILQSQLKEVGIDVKITTVTDWLTFRDRMAKGTHEMFLNEYGWLDPDILHLIFGKGNSTKLYFETDELEALLIKGRQEIDEDRRMKAYEEVGEYLVKASPWVPLYNRETVTAYRDIEGFKSSASTGVIFQDIKLKKK